MRAKVGDYVRVEWTDANYERDQSDLKEALKVETPTVCTFGVLLLRSAEKLVVASEVIHYKADDNYRTSTAIPTGMLVKVETLHP